MASLRSAPSFSWKAPSPALGPRDLGKLVLIDALTPAQLNELAQHLQSDTLDAGDFLFKQGAKDGTLYIIASGIASMTRETETGAKETSAISARRLYRRDQPSHRHAARATASAKSHCEIYKLSRDAIAPLLAKNEELVAAFDRSVRRGLDLLNREVAVRSTPEINGEGQLLQRIRSFFQFFAA